MNLSIHDNKQFIDEVNEVLKKYCTKYTVFYKTLTYIEIQEELLEQLNRYYTEPE